MFAPSVWWCCCRCEWYLVIESWTEEAETGGATLHDKMWSGFTCTVLIPHSICWVDGLVCSECLITTDEQCCALSIGKGSVMAVMAELAIPRSSLIGCHKWWQMHRKREIKQSPPMSCTIMTLKAMAYCCGLSLGMKPGSTIFNLNPSSSHGFAPHNVPRKKKLRVYC